MADKYLKLSNGKFQDTETGEILTRADIKALQHDKDFFLGWISKVQSITKDVELTDKAVRLFFFLVSIMKPKFNSLPSQAKVAKMIGMQPKQVNNYYAVYKEKQMIFCIGSVGTIKTYVINPYIAFNGYKEDKDWLIKRIVKKGYKMKPKWFLPNTQ